MALKIGKISETSAEMNNSDGIKIEMSIDTYGVFGLITDLCKSLVGKQQVVYQTRRHKARIVKRMRTTAFAVLLNKHFRYHHITDDQPIETLDPVAEILKYCFVLKTTTNSFSSASKLENALNNLMDVDGNYNSSLKSILIFLYHLKKSHLTESNNVDPFHIGIKHSELPKTDQLQKNIPQYQIYPLSALDLPMEIHELLKPTESEFGTTNLQMRIRGCSDSQLGIVFNACPFSYNLNLAANISGEYQKIHARSIAMLPSDQNEFRVQHICSRRVPLISLISDISPMRNNNSSDNMHNHTWETMGNAATLQYPFFVSESVIAMEYIESMHKSLSLSEKTDAWRYKHLESTTMGKFMEDSKFVLLGIESSTYTWNDRTGFTFNTNITIPELSNSSLQNICSAITHWATCFKLLSLLVHPNTKSGELRPDDLIHKALCNSIEEILIHYQGIILHVFCHNYSPSLLNLFNRLEGIGFFISEVARLCRCDRTCHLTLGEGTGILSHVYNEVTRVTKPEITLVYYSVLKSCCEVYFHLLGKWIFEGICDEACGEFMINARSQYLHNRGHKFWTRCFEINQAAVPGFLKNLTDSILECGKTVRLLKICDPKNPMCQLFTTNRPTVGVCLNMKMLSEQEKICLEYMVLGVEILGANVTLSSALREMKLTEKKRGDRVSIAHHYTLERMERCREQARLRLLLGKHKLFVDQKKQYEDLTSQKAEARETVSSDNRSIMEQQLIGKEISRSKQLADTRANSDYYKDLEMETGKRCSKSLWRAKRMALFDQRMIAIFRVWSDEEYSINHENCDQIPKYFSEDTSVRHDMIIVKSNFQQQKSIVDPTIKDENYNTSDQKIDEQQKTERDVQIKADRPTILNVTSRDTRIFEDKVGRNQFSNVVHSETGVNLCGLTQKNVSDVYGVPDATIMTIGNSRSEVLSNDNNSNMIAFDGGDNNGGIIIDNIKQQQFPNGTRSNAMDDVQYSQEAINCMNETTPMSCTTDSYVASATGSSISYNCNTAESAGESKREFGTSTTPGDYRTIPHTIKDEYSIDNIFTSQSPHSDSFKLDNGAIPIIETFLTKADVGMIDNTSLQVYLEKSVLLPLRIQRKLANSAIIKCLLHDHQILLHLHSLRSFFFLLNGEFARNLTCPLYTKLYEVTVPAQLFNSHTLTNLLKNALHCSLNGSYIHSELLSLTAFGSPTILQILDPQALNCLCLHYNVSWPLNIILDDASMQQYGKVFKFLLMIGRVLWVLQEDFSILKHDRKAAKSRQYHRVQLFRHAMMQFMTALHNYITCSVLHASWAEFEKDLENTRTLDQIYTTHVNYIKKILSRCMLTNRGEKLRICLSNIFEIILKFHNCLRSYVWIADPISYIHPNFRKMEQMYDAFCILRTYLAQVVDRSATGGYQMHLSHFVDALNINPLFHL